MTVSSEPVSAPLRADEPKENGFQRIMGVLMTPISTFESIAKRPDILVPLLVLVVLSLASNILVARNLDFAAVTRQAIEESQTGSSQPMNADQMERGIKLGAAVAKATTYAAPVIQVIVFAIVAGLFLIGFRMFGGEGDFKQAFSITTYSWYPLMINGILATIVILSRKSISAADLRNPVRSNLGFLVDYKTHPFGAALLGSLDAFTIWTVVLMIIGFAAMSKLSKGKAAGIVITYWVLYVGIFKMTGAAFQAMRMKAS